MEPLIGPKGYRHVVRARTLAFSQVFYRSPELRRWSLAHLKLSRRSLDGL